MPGFWNELLGRKKHIYQMEKYEGVHLVRKSKNLKLDMLNLRYQKGNYKYNYIWIRSWEDRLGRRII